MLAAGDYDYCLVEIFPCNDKTGLHQRERFYIESNECVNKVVPGRTQTEHYEANKGAILEQQKTYRSENKGAISEQQKIYRSEHKDKRVEHIKEYQYENKDEIEANISVNISCECGCTIRKGDISKHRKSQKHINLMLQKEQQTALNDFIKLLSKALLA